MLKNLYQHRIKNGDIEKYKNIKRLISHSIEGKNIVFIDVMYNGYYLFCSKEIK